MTRLSYSVAAVLAIALASPALAETLTVKPYVQNVTASSAILMWRTDEAGIGQVRYANSRTVKELAATTHHSVQLTGLPAGAAIPYQLLSGDRVVAEGTFRTPPAGSGKARFAIVGDTGSGNANQKAIAERLAAYRPEFVLHTGDVVYDDGEERLYPGRFFKPFAPISANAPVYPVFGNHDVKAEKGAAYLRAFDLPAKASGTERYYSFRWGQAEFFAIDTTDRDFMKAGTPQVAWLERALASSNATWKVVYGHHPFYSNGADGGKGFLRSRVQPLFQKYGVDLYVNGHEHNYERFLNPIAGTRYLITGGGGAWLRPGRQKFQDKNKPSIYKDVYHFMAAEMDGNRLTLKAVDKEGKMFDEVVLTK